MAVVGCKLLVRSVFSAGRRLVGAVEGCGSVVSRMLRLTPASVLSWIFELGCLYVCVGSAGAAVGLTGVT